ncbi:hypothetical protein SASPL_150830 [Salvia splendens]|uniref:Uncharacterized protein n=1 Tax=Salvia splendens TaxID=180675 RepID=A0A8X8W6S6_SALSN|nr:hypothetical protein SASPL_150830 [Salvia splendens]
MFAKFDRLLDMMESRMDAVDRRVENLRRKQYPSPHQSGRSRNIPDGFFSRHPEDAANRCIGYPRAPPLREPPPHPTPSPPYAQRTRRSYLPLSQPPPARSSSSGYTARQYAHQLPLNASTPGDQFVEQEQPPRQPYCVRKSPKSGWFSQESHQQRFLPPKKQTCWDLPIPRQYVGSPVSDAPPARQTWRWDQRETRIRQRVSAYKPPPPTGWPPQPQSSSVLQPTCWDPQEQQGYPPHEPPPWVEPLDRECAKFRRLSQQLQPHRYGNEVDKDRCYGEVITHTYSPTLDMSLGSYVSGYANELTGHKEVDSYLSSLDVQIAYSYSDCVDDRGKGEEELCDSKDSIFETTAKEAMDRGLPTSI